VPLHIPPQFFLRNQPTPLCLGKDMNHEILKDNTHILWLKSPNCRRRSENGLDIVVLLENPLRQVMTSCFCRPWSNGSFSKCPEKVWCLAYPRTASRWHQHSPGLCSVHYHNSPWGFPSSLKRVSTLVVRTKPPQNELPKVLQNSSLQTQRDTIISTQVSQKQIYIYDPLKKGKKYYLK